MKKIPYGIIEYKKLIAEGYEYIDKTMYLEKLENIEETLMYLRPGRFGICSPVCCPITMVRTAKVNSIVYLVKHL